MKSQQRLVILVQSLPPALLVIVCPCMCVCVHVYVWVRACVVTATLASKLRTSFRISKTLYLVSLTLLRIPFRDAQNPTIAFWVLQLVVETPGDLDFLAAQTTGYNSDLQVHSVFWAYYIFLCLIFKSYFSTIPNWLQVNCVIFQ